MDYPPFFDDVRRIRMRDPLLAFLGGSDSGIVEYSYRDAVKLAGHSCPTVAGTWLMLAKGLEALYGREVPERGAIRVALPDSRDQGVAGVMANVAALVTGATASDGFKGLGGRFDRRDLLSFGQGFAGDLRLARVDTGAAVTLTYAASAVVPPAPEMQALLRTLLGGGGGEAERREFGRLWQERVRRILLDCADDPRLLTVTLS
ncbi:MAG: hypothetical protein H7841_11035 [Magnetospirillum sp. WYHS-4]